jgi:nucleoside-diphosphate-sugar epimerase
MSKVLVTGASGFIGQALAKSMSDRHEVLCMSRRDPALDLPWIKGDFASFEDLRQLDHYSIDAVVHLAAVIGGCLERNGMLVNVEGPRCLMRYLVDRGCRKFVMASSIAAVGFQSTEFRPLAVPISDEHPCFDRDGYGFSKYMMEEVTRYYWRQCDDIDVINFRLASISPDEDLPPGRGIEPLGQWSLGTITRMALSDAVRAFSLATEAPIKTGVRIMNATAPKAWVSKPVAEVLRNWWGEDVDVSHFEQLGHEYDSVFEVTRIREQLGFEAKLLP